MTTSKKNTNTKQRKQATTLGKESVVLFGENDNFIAGFDGKTVSVMRFSDVASVEQIVLTEVKLEFETILARAGGRRQQLVIYAIEREGALWSIDFSPYKECVTSGGVAVEPRCCRVAESITDPIRDVVIMRRNIVLQTRPNTQSGQRLYALDRRSGLLTNIGELNLDPDITALDGDRNDILLGRHKGEQRLILFGENCPNGGLEIHEFESPRVTAATVVDGTHLVLGHKGGLVNKIDLRGAVAGQVSRTADPLARACYVLRTLMERCGCDCKDQPGGSSGDNDPDRPDRPEDDEPCGDRHVARLNWTAYRFYRNGTHLIATSKDATRMAVLDVRLNVKFERKLDQKVANVLTGQTSSQNILIHLPRKNQLEALVIADLIREFEPRFPDGFTFIPPKPMPSVTYWGKNNQLAAPNPDLKVCVLPVIEPGQNFADSDQTKFMDQIEAKMFGIVNDYYDENSFGDLDVQFTMFGHDIGGMRKPLVLPRAMASYWRDSYRAGGLEAVMPADWSDPVVLDGTETLEIQANPRAGAVKTYDIPFAAMWSRGLIGNYPVNIDFDGTELLELAVETQNGVSQTLTVNFPALSLTHNQGDDDDAFLTTLANHVTDAIRSAESVLPGNPVLIQNVEFRRIRTSVNDASFGELIGMFRNQAVAPADFMQKGQISVVSSGPTPAALLLLGLSSAHIPGVMNSESRTNSYFDRCFAAAQADANEGSGQSTAYFSSNVGTVEDSGAQLITVSVNLTTETGGNMATIEVVGSSSLNGTGWDSAMPNPGSESNPNSTNTLRDHIDLADDAFTAALDHIRATTAWNRGAVENTFASFDVYMVGCVGAPHAATPAADKWDADDPDDFGSKRMAAFGHYATDLNPLGGEDPVQMGTARVITQNFGNFSNVAMTGETGTMTHELGHALGLPDLYSAVGYRDDVSYISPWGMMGGGNSNFHHLCGWSKWSLGWIPEDSDEALNRVIDVDLPDPGGVSVTEAWLVPVEYWDGAMRGDVRNEVGGSVPIGQLMKINLGSDGGVLNFLELRANGAQFSQNLSPQPSVIATNGLDPNTDRDWAVNGLYRRRLHLLNNGSELTQTNDTWDFSLADEFPLTGCTVEIADTRIVRGSIPVYRLRIEREQADYIDLHFQDHAPSYKSPDIWVDWAGDNLDPAIPRVYPVGTPTDQGETVRFPDSGTEKHYVVARVHNAGTANAEEVKVRWFVCDPPGAGDDGRWVDRGTQTIPLVESGTNEIVPFDWNVDRSTNAHQCMRMEIIDWTIPSEVDPDTGDTVALASDDVKLQNNNAQQNVFDFEALTGSPYPPINFQMQVHNDRNRTEIAALVPQGLPYGSKLTISPREWSIPTGERRIFNCTLQLDEDKIQPGCDNDSGLLLTAWRRDGEADENWGSCFYHIRPRWKTGIELLRGSWFNGHISIYGFLHVFTETPIDISEDMPLMARIRLMLEDTSDGTTRIEWRAVGINSDGSFHLETDPESGSVLKVQAWFDRTDRLGSATSNELILKHSVIG
ncbi:MAG: hypothetical protein V3U75_05260 [Methylococcaceae bacterium]